MAKTPDSPKLPGKTPKSRIPKSNASKSKAPKSKAHRPELQPIGPALADLLNPAINRVDAGLGSGTGLQPPPDNSWDRRSGGEAAAHRARASTRGKSEITAKRDATTQRDAALTPHHQKGAVKQKGFDEAPQSELATPTY
ncbi:MAG TPA: excinuclease ABC subunit UvrB, partial [Nitrobacter sp.]|nr:excinuclease ABC subunit UvrB [Nitrobacter sp.]